MKFDNTMETIFNLTPADVSKRFTHSELYDLIGCNTGLDIDSLANIIGNDDVENMTGAEMTDNLDVAWPEWYNDDNIPEYTPKELATDIVIYTAWQIASKT